MSELPGRPTRIFALEALARTRFAAGQHGEARRLQDEARCEYRSHRSVDSAPPEMEFRYAVYAIQANEEVAQAIDTLVEQCRRRPNLFGPSILDADIAPVRDRLIPRLDELARSVGDTARGRCASLRDHLTRLNARGRPDPTAAKLFSTSMRVCEDALFAAESVLDSLSYLGALRADKSIYWAVRAAETLEPLLQTAPMVGQAATALQSARERLGELETKSKHFSKDRAFLETSFPLLGWILGLGGLFLGWAIWGFLVGVLTAAIPLGLLLLAFERAKVAEKEAQADDQKQRERVVLRQHEWHAHTAKFDGLASLVRQHIQNVGALLHASAEEIGAVPWKDYRIPLMDDTREPRST